MGVLYGTGSMMPRLTSLSRASFTSFFQWCGTGMGECTADGVASGWKVIPMGFPIMVCKGWCGHVLKALEAQ